MEYFYIPAKTGEVHMRDYVERAAYPLLVGAENQERAEQIVQTYLGARTNTAGRPIRTPMNALGKLSPFGPLMSIITTTQAFCGSVTIRAVIMTLPKSKDVQSTVVIEAEEQGKVRVFPLQLEQTRDAFRRIVGTRLQFKPEDLAGIVTSAF